MMKRSSHLAGKLSVYIINIMAMSISFGKIFILHFGIILYYNVDFYLQFVKIKLYFIFRFFWSRMKVLKEKRIPLFVINFDYEYLFLFLQTK